MALENLTQEQRVFAALVLYAGLRFALGGDFCYKISAAFVIFVGYACAGVIEQTVDPRKGGSRSNVCRAQRDDPRDEHEAVCEFVPDFVSLERISLCE